MLETIKKLHESGIFVVLLEIIAAGLALYAVPFIAKRLPSATTDFFEWLKTKAGNMKSVYIAGILQRLTDLAGQKVLMVENTIIEDLKDKARDGKITQEELLNSLSKAKQTVVDAVKADANSQKLWEVAMRIFFGDEAAMNKWLSDIIEAHVAKLPPSGLQTSALYGKAPAGSHVAQPPPPAT